MRLNALCLVKITKTTYKTVTTLLLTYMMTPLDQ